MNYKLICMDMDGTLLNDEKKISQRSLEAIKEAQSMGVKTVISTGRIFNSACYYSDIIGSDSPVIALNGAYVGFGNNNQVLYAQYLGISSCMEICAALRKFNIVPHFYTKDTIYTGEIIYTSLSYLKGNKQLPPKRKVNIVKVDDWDGLFKEQPLIVKALAVDKDREKIKKAKEYISSLDKYEIVSSFESSFEIMPKETSKGMAVKRVCEYYNIDRSQVIAFGDNENDRSMIEFAGLGVAMENGDQIAKAAAGYITGSNNDDGVAAVIEKYVINR